MTSFKTITITVDKQTLNRIDAVKPFCPKKNRSYAARRLIAWGFSHCLQSNYFSEQSQTIPNGSICQEKKEINKCPKDY
tara:strand:- start:203 stop:439 length:237 start_codon:yes stop_codon:yes gene_type:complete